MASAMKINPSSKVNNDTGFGVQGSQIGGRFVNKDGTFNLRKEGLPLWERLSVFSWVLELSWTRFFGIIILFYFLENVFFTSLYLLAGVDGLQGFVTHTYWGKIKEIFFFSTETITTVGYGRINPIGNWSHLISAMESMTGWLSLALVTGLLYGRFSRPQAYIAFSHAALISPYKDGIGLMFRMVPFKENHFITDAKVVVNIAFMQTEEDNQVYKFYQLKLERSKIDSFSMNWTVVHPIDEESPLLNFTEDDLAASDLEMFVQVTGFDHYFSSTVIQRTSYTYKEIVWGAKYEPMYHESADGNTTILQIDKLNDHKKVSIDKKV